MMSLLRIFHVSGSAVSAQSQRLNTVSSNLANADTAAGPDGKSFKARQVVFQTLPMSDDAGSVGVKVSAVREDDTLETLEARIHEVEHELYPQVLRLVAEGRIGVGEDRKVHVRP